MNSIYLTTQKIYDQLSPEELIERAIARKEGVLNSTGALCINTGKFTGRSPKDKFIVRDSLSAETVDWQSEFNNPIDESQYQKLRSEMQEYINSSSELFRRTCYAVAKPDYQLKINVITETASANLFACNMFLRPEELETEDIFDEWTLIHLPGFEATPELHGTRAENFAVISFGESTILIGGTGYTGEIKKSVFTVLNYLLPCKGVLSMHCSANRDKNGDVALFFGLSGTGKTTLSADPDRILIGDDEHGWDDDGIFNFEGGCYAKTIGLKKEFEPEIFNAIRRGALVENICFKEESNVIDFGNSSLTENTRVSYPLHFISNSAKPSRGNPPSTIFFLTCDATGVLPPISKLSPEQASYFFLSGYTSKIAGTEAGITQPKSTFSTCFGAPFLPLKPQIYAGMLKEKLKHSKIDVWLVNTGWTGLAFDEGERINLKYTRAMVREAMSGKLSNGEFEIFPKFNLEVPLYCNGVPSEILNPLRNPSRSEYFDQRLNALWLMFQENFKKFD